MPQAAWNSYIANYSLGHLILLAPLPKHWHCAKSSLSSLHCVDKPSTNQAASPVQCKTFHY